MSKQMTGAEMVVEALKDQGALTDEEFRQAKAKLLSRL